MIWHPYWASVREYQSQLDDPFNLLGKRTIRNTDKSLYNCGGYALNCFSWYCPKEDDSFYFGFDSEQEAEEKTKTSVGIMLAEFPDLRMVASLTDVRFDEYAILFRISCYGDFHYLKRDSGGHWRHKMGDAHCISTIKTQDIFKDWYGGFYDGPITILAKKRG